MSTKGKTLVVIAGPTASGKTTLTIRLAQAFDTEIISADSRQFYREIPIGTAAPTIEEQALIPHHFVGHLSVFDEYNISMYEKDVLQLLSEKFKEKDILFMTGGSGLYINAVCNGIDPLPDPTPELREELNQLLKKEGISALQNILKELDPEYYAEVDTNNPVRLQRAIEICRGTGRKYSELRSNQPVERNFNIIKIALNVNRDELARRIHMRTHAMLEAGWTEEARIMFPHKHLNALNTVGYKELFSYFEGKLTLEEAVEKIETNTRRYAKRQRTWFRKDKDIHWFAPEDIQGISNLIKGHVYLD
ncbi:MAG: tRNA (adenosine(37)-N6)-dimethylallyltransferase MiaA [Bacteroidales bacterium]|nr:tRNA (adenosine(37)-N6)-dimethylallyltransferase MiaA [Bacteroidales bacterium]